MSLRSGNLRDLFQGALRFGWNFVRNFPKQRNGMATRHT